MNSGGNTTTTTADAQAGKVRLYEVAKDLGLANKDLVAKVRALGIEVKNHMSNLDPDDVARVKRALDKERQANLVEERLSSTVIRRRSKDGGVITRAATPAAASPSARAPERPSRDADEERAILERQEAAAEATRSTQEVAHEVVEKIVPSTQEKPVEPTVETRREEAPRRVVVEQPRRGGEHAPQVEVRETVRHAPPPQAREEAPQVEAKGEPQAPAAPGTTTEPKKDEPVSSARPAA